MRESKDLKHMFELVCEAETHGGGGGGGPGAYELMARNVP